MPQRGLRVGRYQLSEGCLNPDPIGYIDVDRPVERTIEGQGAAPCRGPGTSQETPLARRWRGGGPFPQTPDRRPIVWLRSNFVSQASTLKVSVLPGDFGAVAVLGMTPSMASDVTVQQALRSALAVHAVLCLRQSSALDDDGLRAFAMAFGPIKDPIGRTKEGGTLRYSDERQIVDAGFVLTEELRAQLGGISFGGLDPQRPGLFETFHTDDSFTERPAAATVLNARELPKNGGGPTWFLDMRAAYRSLEPDVRQRLTGLRALNRYNNGGAFPPRIAAEGPFEALVDVVQPIVRAHPVTGEPALYLDLDRAVSIEGMEDTEGRELLRFLQQHAEEAGPTYAHGWQEHDVLVWDNASVQHRASGDFAVGEPRNFWRYMIEGPAPKPFVA